MFMQPAWLEVSYAREESYRQSGRWSRFKQIPAASFAVADALLNEAVGRTLYSILYASDAIMAASSLELKSNYSCFSRFAIKDKPIGHIISERKSYDIDKDTDWLP